MALVLNGSGTIAGISAGGLPDGCITADDLASGVGGKVLQVVSAEIGTYSASTSSTYADTALTLSITPSSASSKVLVLANPDIFWTRSGGGQAQSYMRISRNSAAATSNERHFYIYNANGDPMSSEIPAFHSWLDSPATTSSVTYTLQFKIGFGEIRLNNYTDSTITLMEIAA